MLSSPTCFYSRTKCIFFFVGIGEFGFIPIHAKPDDAVVEIDALVDVYDGMVSLWEMEVSRVVGNAISFHTVFFIPKWVWPSAAMLEFHPVLCIRVKVGVSF